MSIDTLIRRQNRDGGWPYHRGASWTEPTVYAVLSLLGAGEREPAERGLEWLRKTQRADGGWPAQPAVEDSNWTTGLVALLPPEELGARPHRGSIEWLMGTIDLEASLDFRLRQWLLGKGTLQEAESMGWPWVPGTAGWVGPTSIAILALDKENRRRPLLGIRHRIKAGRDFLLQRECRGGGWNYGSVRPLGFETKPYPEMTGMALAALRGAPSAAVERSVRVAREFLAGCRSADAVNWLRLGLIAQGELPGNYCPPADLSFRTIPETSLDLLTLGATAGKSLFWC